MDWTALLTGGGGAVVAIIGAYGLWKVRLLTTRSTLTIAEQEAAAKVKRDDTAIARKDRKDTIDELYQILDVQRKDREEDRQLIHGLRTDLGTAQTRLAVCEFERSQMREEIADLRAAVEQAGITVKHRPAPAVVPFGPDGEATSE